MASHYFLASSEHTISTVANGAISVFAIDVDGDGDIDVLSASYLMANSLVGKIAWYENDGAQNFTEHVISTTSGDDTRSVYAIDLDGDGDIDVLSASYVMVDSSAKIAWYENDGAQNFTQRVIPTSAEYGHSVFAIDIDGDGDIDILSASGDEDKTVWYENDGAQSFTERVISTSAYQSLDMFAIDVDGDGDIDILSALNPTLGSSASFAKIAWYENDGAQSFTERVISTSADAASWSVFAIDVDGDGDIDVLSSSGSDDKIAWYENDGAQSFTERVISTTSGDDTRSVYAIDVDGDGDIDVLSASYNDDKIAWYENDGAQSFTERVISTSADGAYSVFAIDVDGDGDIDVLSASNNDDKIAWYKNLMPPPIPTTAPTLQSNSMTTSIYNQDRGLVIAAIVVSSILLALLSAILVIILNKKGVLIYPNEQKDKLSKPSPKRRIIVRRKPNEEDAGVMNRVRV